MNTKFDLKGIEEQAKGKPVGSVLVHYEGRSEPVRYAWEKRAQIKWDNVRRIRLDFTSPKSYLIHGEAATRPGFRVRKS